MQRRRRGQRRARLLYRLHVQRVRPALISVRVPDGHVVGAGVQPLPDHERMPVVQVAVVVGGELLLVAVIQRPDGVTTLCGGVDQHVGRGVEVQPVVVRRVGAAVDDRVGVGVDTDRRRVVEAGGVDDALGVERVGPGRAVVGGHRDVVGARVQRVPQQEVVGRGQDERPVEAVDLGAAAVEQRPDGRRVAGGVDQHLQPLRDRQLEHVDVGGRVDHTRDGHVQRQRDRRPHGAAGVTGGLRHSRGPLSVGGGDRPDLHVIGRAVGQAVDHVVARP